jgi:WD40 repeat protein
MLLITPPAPAEEPGPIMTLSLDDRIMSVSVQAVDKRILVLTLDRRIFEIDFGRNKVAVKKVPAGPTGAVPTEMSPDGKLMVSRAHEDDEHRSYLEFVDKKSEPILLSKQRVGGYCFSPTGKKLAFIDFESVLHVWDTVAVKEVACVKIDGYERLTANGAFSSDEKQYFVALGFGAVLCDIETKKQRTWDPDGALFDDTSFTGPPNGPPTVGFVATPLPRGEITVGVVTFDKETKVRPVSGLDEDVTHVALTPDGEILAIASQRGRIRLWDVAKDKFVQEFQTKQKNIGSIQFATKEFLVSQTTDNTIAVWKLEK